MTRAASEDVHRYSKNYFQATMLQRSNRSHPISSFASQSPRFIARSSLQAIRWKSSPTVNEEVVESALAKAKKMVEEVPKPTNVQLRNHFMAHAIPMVSQKRVL